MVAANAFNSARRENPVFVSAIVMSVVPYAFVVTLPDLSGAFSRFYACKLYATGRFGCQQLNDELTKTGIFSAIFCAKGEGDPVFPPLGREQTADIGVIEQHCCDF